jgi:hypothetical protein
VCFPTGEVTFKKGMENENMSGNYEQNRAFIGEAGVGNFSIWNLLGQ